mgnify:CR=1 FL=1
MARIPYSIFRLSKQARFKVNIATAIMSVPIAGPFLIAWIQSYFISEPVWFNRWFDLENSSNGLVAGPYLVFAGIFFFLVGLIVGDEALKNGEISNYGETYKQATSPFGFVSQIMLICQTGAFFMVLFGALWFFSAL